MHVQFIGTTPSHATNINLHKHSTWEIVYYFSGTGVLNLCDEHLQFQEGDIICHPPEAPHSEYSEKGFRDIYVRVEDFVSPSPGIPRFKDNSNHDFYNILSQLYREFHLKQNNWIRIVDQLFSVLYQYMIGWNEVHRKNELVEKFEGILVSNISNFNFKLDDSLKCIPLSPDHFRRLFKKETGQTPIEYLIEKRIVYAKQLLESSYSSNMKIKEISVLSGFNDPYYFSRLFKKITGKSPTDWGTEYK